MVPTAWIYSIQPFTIPLHKSNNQWWKRSLNMNQDWKWKQNGLQRSVPIHWNSREILLHSHPLEMKILSENVGRRLHTPPKCERILIQRKWPWFYLGEMSSTFMGQGLQMIVGNGKSLVTSIGRSFCVPLGRHDVAGIQPAGHVTCDRSLIWHLAAKLLVLIYVHVLASVLWFTKTKLPTYASKKCINSASTWCACNKISSNSSI